MNSLFQQLNGNKINQPIMPNNIRQMANMFKMMRNPQAFIQSQLSSNPQLRAVMDSSGGNYEKAFKDMCNQMNVNPDDIINMLK